MSSSLLKPVEKITAAAQVTENLRAYIMSGSVPPGGRLTETALAKRLVIGRSTLRTGLQKLAEEGLVVQVPYTGWHVAQLTAGDVWELWTLRGSLEGLAARLAAESQDPGGRHAIEAAYGDLLAACAAGDMAEISEKDFALHRTIVHAAGHSRLMRQYLLVEQQIRLYILTSNLCVADGPEDIINQHRPIAEALLAGDAPRAAHEALYHNESEGQRLLDWIRAQDGMGHAGHG